MLADTQLPSPVVSCWLGLASTCTRHPPRKHDCFIALLHLQLPRRPFYVAYTIKLENSLDHGVRNVVRGLSKHNAHQCQVPFLCTTNFLLSTSFSFWPTHSTQEYIFPPNATVIFGTLNSPIRRFDKFSFESPCPRWSALAWSRQCLCFPYAVKNVSSLTQHTLATCLSF